MYDLNYIDIFKVNRVIVSGLVVLNNRFSYLTFNDHVNCNNKLDNNTDAH